MKIKKTINNVVDINTPRKISLPNPSIDKDIKIVRDVIHKDLTKKVTLSNNDPDDQANKKGTLIDFKRASGIIRKRRNKNKPKRYTSRRIKFDLNAWLADDKSSRKHSMKSISGGVVSEVYTEDALKDDARAKKGGYLGVRKVYLMEKPNLPSLMEYYSTRMTEEEHKEIISEKISLAIEELSRLYEHFDEDGEHLFSDIDDVKDLKIFNKVASILIRVWGHNYLNRLNDLRINTIVLLLKRDEVSWRKIAELLAEWENLPPLSR